jgi:phosphoribosylformylglycinamidine synthase subunit PurL
MPPGAADATVLKLAGPGVEWKGKGLSLTCDANPAWCAASPRHGAELVVAEALLNISCTGAGPVAVVDCLNFGNPEHPLVMWQLAETIDGLAAACQAFGVPVVGGNVSLYNETNGTDIDPTPVVAMVGVIERLEHRPPGIDLAEGAALVLLGDSVGPAGAPLDEGGEPALTTVEFTAHQRLCEMVRRLVAAECTGAPSVPICGLHDASEGGLAVCLAELCCASGLGATITESWGSSDLFAERPSRVLVCTRQPDELLTQAASAGVPGRLVGRAGGDRLVVGDVLDLSVSELSVARSSVLSRAAEGVTA